MIEIFHSFTKLLVARVHLCVGIIKFGEPPAPHEPGSHFSVLITTKKQNWVLSLLKFVREVSLQGNSLPSKLKTQGITAYLSRNTGSWSPNRSLCWGRKPGTIVDKLLEAQSRQLSVKHSRESVKRGSALWGVCSLGTWPASHSKYLSSFCWGKGKKNQSTVFLWRN